MKKVQFDPIEAQLDLVSLEKGILEHWDKSHVFDKINTDRKDASEWVYYDGPITANGRPHYGHMITWSLKDVLPRYQTMLGRYVSRNIGWDCQGIPVEFEVEKQLGFKHKDDIEKFGIANFNQKCRESVLRYRSTMVEYETRLGRWVDHNDEYSTMESKYIESMWWSIKQLFEKGYLYEGHKVVAYSTRAGMTLSTQEVAEGGYSEVIDSAVTLAFPLTDDPHTAVLAWTTTPWTLPGNLLLAVGKGIQYVRVESEGKQYILAKDAVERVFTGKKYQVQADISAESLVGKSYEPLFQFYADRREHGAFKIIYADHVKTDEGTGIVHLAPYGEEDFLIFQQMRMPLFDYLTDTGEFTDAIAPYSGMFYKKANDVIIEDLQKAGLLFAHAEYAHQMPMCYRTKTPLIYKPITSWYVDIKKLKPQLLKHAETIHWVPAGMKGRFLQWIENARDWSLSRRRYWGTPLPVWINDKTREIVVIGSFEELAQASNQPIPADFDPHRPYVDDITWEKDGGTFRRAPEVIDVWYDSGSMPFAQYHYPFENQEKFARKYPAQYISEGDDQIRLWFYTMFVLGVALFDKKPFENVIVTGIMGDDTGKRMSKSKGNYPPVEEVFEKYGSDMLRYFLLTSPVIKGDFVSFSYSYLLDMKKEFFSTLWNSYRYFVTYADIYGLPDAPVEATHVLDRWVLARLNEVVAVTRSALDSYDILTASREFTPFVDDLSNWYIRRSRDRLSNGDLGALQTLHTCLFTFAKVIAPFVPLFADAMYLNLKKGTDEDSVSVHTTLFPTAVTSSETDDLVSHMKIVRTISSIGNAMRKEQNLAVRQPLAEMVVQGVSEDFGADLMELITDELNVKKVTFADAPVDTTGWVQKEEQGITVFLNTVISDDLLVEGYARELVRELQKMRKEANVAFDAEIKATYPKEARFEQAMEKFGGDIRRKALCSELSAGDSFSVVS